MLPFMNSLFHRDYKTRTFEPYREEHYPAVRKLALDHLYKLVAFTPGVPSDAAFARNVLPCLTKEGCLVALEDGRPVGFVTYETGAKKPSTLWRSFAKVNHLAVDSLCQKKGHGEALLREALSRLESQGADFVTLRLTDLDLEKYYGRFGFRPQFTFRNGPEQFGEMLLKLGPEKSTSLKDRLVTKAAGQLPRFKAYGFLTVWFGTLLWFTRKD